MKYFKENDIDIPKYSKYCSFVKKQIKGKYYVKMVLIVYQTLDT